jgi:hypothetical protein
MNKLKYFFSPLMWVVLSLNLMSCGGGGSSELPSLSWGIQGAALVGAPLQDVTITISDAAGGQWGPIAQVGAGVWRYAFDTKTNMTAPLLVQARGYAGGKEYRLHSLVSQLPAPNQVVNINVTPITDAMTRVALSDPEGVIQNKLMVPSVSAGSIQTIHANMVKILEQMLLKFGLTSEVNFFTDSVLPDGKGMDALMDSVRFAKQDAKIQISNLQGGQIQIPVTSFQQTDLTGNLSVLPADTLSPTLFEALVSIATAFQQAESGNTQALDAVFHQVGFWDAGNSLAVFKLRNPQWFDGSIKQVSISLDSCESRVRDQTIVNDKDFGLIGQVCSVTIGYKTKTSTAWQTWASKVLFSSSMTSVPLARLIGNQEAGPYVTGLNQLSIDTFDATGTVSVAQASLDKINYVKANFKFTGAESIDSWEVIGNKFNSTHGIRGRGNTSWWYPKKGYRVKFTQVYDDSGVRVAALESKSPAGRAASRDWVLLAQWREEDLLVTPAAQMAARMMGNPAVNSAIPVELTWNGVYRGVYLLTETISAGTGRVDIDISKTADKGGDYIIELSREYDQPGEQFRSTIFNGQAGDDSGGSLGLPVMIKEAKSSTAATTLSAIQTHFLQLEQALDNLMRQPMAEKENAIANVSAILDPVSTGRYFAATRVINNYEWNHPKSVYFYYKKGKYYMGPLWDFDWSRYQEDISYSEAQRPFLQTMYAHREVKKNFCDALVQFRDNFSTFEDFVDNYAHALQYGFLRDRALWSETEDRNSGWPPSRIARPQTIQTQLNLLKSSYKNRTAKLISAECPGR